MEKKVRDHWDKRLAANDMPIYSNQMIQERLDGVLRSLSRLTTKYDCPAPSPYFPRPDSVAMFPKWSKNVYLGNAICKRPETGFRGPALNLSQRSVPLAMLKVHFQLNHL